LLRFYNDRRKQLASVEPNDAHRILYELEKDFDVTVITQNVDNLHERAGSTKIIHLLGELTKVRSSRHRDMIFDVGYRPVMWGEQAPDGSRLRPHIVWYGEPVPMIEAAQATVAAADIFVIVGSALEVYPAAELVKYASANASIYLINPSEVKNQGRLMTVIREKATVGMGKLKKILTETPIEQQKVVEKNGKTNIYNVVILDQSGSMASIKQEAINGYNETLQTIKAAQQQHADTQEHFVTLVVFNGAATNMVYDRVICANADELTDKTYKPGSNTPLYDAMGTTLSKFRHMLDATADNEVLVTVITDGQENASKEFTGKQIFQLVNELKAQGWVFTYIGANHNVEEAASNMGIRHALKYESSKQGTQEMFMKQNMSRKNFYDRIAAHDDIMERKRMIANDVFFEDEDDNTSKNK
jgi:NAD-dependent deacetylase